MKALSIILALILTALSEFTLKAQKKDFLQDFNFTEYLINTKKDYVSARLNIHLNLKKAIDPATVDSFYFLLGQCHYFTGQLDSASFYWEKIHHGHPFYYQGRFYAVLMHLYRKEYDKASLVLSSIQPEDSFMLELLNYEKSVLYLLTQQWTDFEKVKEQFTFRFFALSSFEKNLLQNYEEIKSFRPKSFLLAGLLSALIPGSGKFYASKPGEGAAAFLMVGSLAALTAENAIKDGFNDPKTLLLGGGFLVFYSGNILGSIVAVKSRREEFKRLKEDEILTDNHILLRNIFFR